MKFIFLLILLTCFKVSASVYAQTITLNLKNAPLAKVFTQIEQQSGYSFFYDNELLKKTRQVNINVKDAKLIDVLQRCFSEQPLIYEIIDNTIIVKQKDKSLLQKARDFLIIPVNIKGKIIDSTGAGLQGAVIKIKGSARAVVTNNDGEFEINMIDENAILIITYVGYTPIEIPVKSLNPSMALVTMKRTISELESVNVVSTGYQTIPQERATGSFTVIDQKTFSRATSSDLLGRLKGVTNGLLFDSRTGNPTGISIRGRSTLFSDTKPLIVVDNFPFEGDLNTINPNDIESVTLLKDAAAASIWGVRAGNGVIVVTTKRGKIGQKPSISFNTNVTIGDKPDLKYQPQLTSSEFIDVEQFLFTNGKYASPLRRNYSLISPIVDILQRQKLGQLTAEQTNAQIDAFRNIDTRDQQAEYFYQKSVRQQYYLNVNGGGPNQTYYFSAGYDKNLANTKGASDSRVSLKGNNSYSFFNNKVRLSTDINFNKTKNDNTNAAGYTPFLPYEQIADAKGNAFATLIGGGLRSMYTDTAGNGKLLDWKYRPLDELRNKNSSSKADLTDYRVLLGLEYKVIKPLTISLNYQYFNSNQKTELSNSKDSYYTRNEINKVSSINSETGYVTRPMPIGDIFTPAFGNTQSNYGRAQVNFSQTFGLKHDINAIAGYEVRDDQSQYNSQTLYGYNPETAISNLVDLINEYPSYYGSGAAYFRLGSNSFQSRSTNRYISYYGSASYTYDQKYVLSGSYRKDESNLFGVKSNQKGVPLWSTGIAWNADKEGSFDLGWLSKLQLKATYGYNGNVNTAVSAYLTANASGPNPFYGENYSTIINPPNDALRWERVKNLNFGLDFSTKNNRVSGGIEYYIKNGTDLIAISPIAPQTGVSIFTGNSADTHTGGLDIQLNSINLTGAFKWQTTSIFNLVKDKVTNYKAPKGTNLGLISAVSLTPVEQYPINSIFGFKWANLDDTGAPQGFLNGEKSKDYTSILNAIDPSQLDFFGSAVPTIFGSLRNTFSYKNIEVSFTVSYKLNYYFRRRSLNYASLFNGSYMQDDYELRWQKPGDERATTVPSVTYPVDNNRNNFYQYSSALVEKGDHIRFQDVQLNYTLRKVVFKSLPMNNLNVYIYANNLGILWRANKHNLDPEVRSGYPTPRTIAFGLSTTF